jgi:transcription elongation factor GreB
MSRAFLSESQQDFMDHDVPEVKFPLPAGVKNYMTPEGALRMRGEVASLRQEHSSLSSLLSGQVAGASGPDKERLQKEKRRLREIERRMQYLDRMRENLEVVDPARQDHDRVLFGARVDVRDRQGAQNRYRIVGVDESDPAEGRISWLSPLARALNGSRVGDTAHVKTPGGELQLKVLSITYT